MVNSEYRRRKTESSSYYIDIRTIGMKLAFKNNDIYSLYRQESVFCKARKQNTLELNTQMGSLCTCGSRGRALVLFTLAFTLNCTRLHCFTPDDTLMQGDFLGPNGALTTPSQIFHLRFYLPTGGNKSKYLGVWFNGGGFLWIANLNNPIPYEGRPKLVIEDNGSMKILYNNDADSIVLYTSTEAANKINASATLLDNGNLVLREMNTDGTVRQILWQSYDFPNYVLLPGMRLGFNNRTGLNWALTSWTGLNTHVTGSFTLGLDPTDTSPQLVIRWNGNLYWASGPLVDGNFGNLTTTSGSGRYDIYFTFVSNENETYFSYNSTSTLPVGASSIRLDPYGRLRGDASVTCSSDNPADVRGCVPQKFPNCRNQHAYVSLMDYKYGNMSQQGYKEEGFDELSLYDCGVKCLNNCSCVAYSSTTDDNTGCQMWDNSTKFYQSSAGRPIYFPQQQNSDHSTKSKANRSKLWIGSVIGGAVVILVSSSYMFFVLWRKRGNRIEAEERLKQKKILYDTEGCSTPSAVNSKRTRSNKIETTNHGMHIFRFESIQLATDNFSPANKLGEGGFGPVYKGQLLDGREVAIKRLCRRSRQGLREFKNEVKLIANFQHTNLVKLHGFCVEREEMMLIYEYMPNKSLDFYLFDSHNKILLDWERRFHIIQGIAQGLVYLHTYSRLTVIHRDLKPSNILLDHEMNPKISDFGMAKIFGLKESQKNTKRVVGTFGYMSPEYALNGIVSTKLDVFSFGVIVLEIVSGKRNASNYDWDCPLNLIGHAWQLWNKGKALQVIDPVLKGACAVNEVLRCIHISLLCAQDQAKDRPTMSGVVSFLSSEAILLAEPKQPAFFTNTGVNEPKFCVTGQENHSLNNVTISTIVGR